MSDQGLLTEKDIERLTTEAADAIHAAATQARLTAGRISGKPLLRGGAAATTKLPELPSVFLWPKILERFGQEADRNAAGYAKFVTSAQSLVGSSLFAQARGMIDAGKDITGVTKELQERIGPDVPQGLNTMQIGLVSGGKVVAGIGGVTGIAIPLHQGSKVKWFSGAEISAGVVIEWEAAALMIGGKKAFPHELTGEFFGAHLGVHAGVGVGLSIYFSANEHLEYEGVSFTVGIGAGGGVAILGGFEIVTSD